MQCAQRLAERLEPFVQGQLSSEEFQAYWEKEAEVLLLRAPTHAVNPVNPVNGWYAYVRWMHSLAVTKGCDGCEGECVECVHPL